MASNMQRTGQFNPGFQNRHPVPIPVTMLQPESAIPGPKATYDPEQAVGVDQNDDLCSWESIDNQLSDDDDNDDFSSWETIPYSPCATPNSTESNSALPSPCCLLSPSTTLLPSPIPSSSPAFTLLPPPCDPSSPLTTPPSSPTFSSLPLPSPPSSPAVTSLLYRYPPPPYFVPFTPSSSTGPASPYPTYTPSPPPYHDAPPFFPSYTPWPSPYDNRYSLYTPLYPTNIPLIPSQYGLYSPLNTLSSSSPTCTPLLYCYLGSNLPSDAPS
ncbi:hypothetical protein ACFX13_041140 [Malus domestica]